MIEFKILACTNMVGSEKETTLEIDAEDLEGIPEGKWDDYVWEELGGKDAFWDLIECGINHA